MVNEEANCFDLERGTVPISSRIKAHAVPEVGRCNVVQVEDQRHLFKRPVYLEAGYKLLAEVR